MLRMVSRLVFCFTCAIVCSPMAWLALAGEEPASKPAELPPVAEKKIDFVADVQSLFALDHSGRPVFRWAWTTFCLK